MTQPKDWKELVTEMNLKALEKRKREDFEKRIGCQGSSQEEVNPRENEQSSPSMLSNPNMESELEYLRRVAPIKGTHWSKKELLTIREAALLYYGIDPNESNPYGVSEYRFESFMARCDEDHILDLMVDSIELGNLQLNRGRIPIKSFCSWLNEKGLPVPQILVAALPASAEPPPAPEPSQTKERPLRNNQKDKAACEALAQALWEQDHKMTIIEVIEHPWIQKYGNGSQYKGEHTLRDWVKPFDPRSKSEKVGRPSKKK